MKDSGKTFDLLLYLKEFRQRTCSRKGAIIIDNYILTWTRCGRKEPSPLYVPLFQMANMHLLIEYEFHSSPWELPYVLLNFEWHIFHFSQMPRISMFMWISCAHILKLDFLLLICCMPFELFDQPEFRRVEGKVFFLPHRYTPSLFLLWVFGTCSSLCWKYTSSNIHMARSLVEKDYHC